MGYIHTNAKGIEYHLNTKEVTLRGGRLSRIYYFSKDDRDTACDLPDDREVVENPHSGFLALKKKVDAPF
jgi:hypothetical protein